MCQEKRGLKQSESHERQFGHWLRVINGRGLNKLRNEGKKKVGKIETGKWPFWEKGLVIACGERERGKEKGVEIKESMVTTKEGAEMGERHYKEEELRQAGEKGGEEEGRDSLKKGLVEIIVQSTKIMAADELPQEISKETGRCKGLLTERDQNREGPMEMC